MYFLTTVKMEIKFLKRYENDKNVQGKKCKYGKDLTNFINLKIYLNSPRTFLPLPLDNVYLFCASINSPVKSKEKSVEFEASLILKI